MTSNIYWESLHFCCYYHPVSSQHLLSPRLFNRFLSFHSVFSQFILHIQSDLLKITIPPSCLNTPKVVHFPADFIKIKSKLLLYTCMIWSLPSLLTSSHFTLSSCSSCSNCAGLLSVLREKKRSRQAGRRQEETEATDVKKLIPPLAPYTSLLPPPGNTLPLALALCWLLITQASPQTCFP